MTQVLLTQQQQATNNQIFDILFNSDDVTWKSLIFGLIHTEQMDPWDIDISTIANKFLATLKQLKQMDFRVSGKIVLASAVLLKLKSDKLMDEEIAALDSLIHSADEPLEEAFFDELGEMDELSTGERARPKLVPRTPQPRTRKVSVYDLVDALEKVLLTDSKRAPKKPGATYKEVKRPTNHVDIGEVIKDVYNKINTHYAGTPTQALTFTHLLPSDNKQDKVLTFIPLLHLDTQRKIDVLQEEHFGEIEIQLLEKDANLDQLSFDASAATTL